VAPTDHRTKKGMEQASRKTTIVRLQPIYEERTKSQIEKEDEMDDLPKSLRGFHFKLYSQISSKINEDISNKDTVIEIVKEVLRRVEKENLDYDTT